MRTKIIIVAVSLIVIGVAVVLALLYGASPAPVPAGQSAATDFPSASTVGQSDGTSGAGSVEGGAGTAGASGADEGLVTGLEFLQATTTIEDTSNPGLYHLDAPPTSDSDVPYDITYESATRYFNISLLAEPIGQTRLAAQTYLMEKLGIAESEMCQLDYMVSVPDWVNDFYAGYDLGFSFCPGAVALPQ
jgi:hypothetical protein